MRRERRKKDFIGMVALTAIAAAGLAFLVGVGINQQITNQADRNAFVKDANEKLDDQIKEIATLRREIDSLKARQAAVENLQSDRTTPVHLLDELVKHTPEGIFFKQIKQDGNKLAVFGYAQSNERVSELLRNLANNTAWLERPDLTEIRSVTLGPQGLGLSPVASAAATRDTKTVYEFTLSALIKSPSAVDSAAAKKTTSLTATPVAAASPAAR
jgi:type IV pilus assembly protein PilN